ncbi:MAG: hypothetical protein LUE97_06325 [Oscillospiraceae bacterium]|nr:hypothetical protein [Oscillospiraceae bacterium]
MAEEVTTIEEEELTEEASTEETTETTEDAHLFLETPFSDYTVTEGLLLIIVLLVFLSAIVKLLKEGFYWLW